MDGTAPVKLDQFRAHSGSAVSVGTPPRSRFFSVGVASEGDDCAVVDEPVDHGFDSAAEWLVGGNDQGGG